MCLKMLCTPLYPMVLLIIIHIIPTKWLFHWGIYPIFRQTHGKSPFFMGKSTISMAIFNSYPRLPYEPPRNSLIHWTTKATTKPTSPGDIWRRLRESQLGWVLMEAFYIRNIWMNPMGHMHESFLKYMDVNIYIYIHIYIWNICG